jgi:hypothetical protein
MKSLTGELTDNRGASYFPLSKMSPEKLHANEKNFSPQ